MEAIYHVPTPKQPCTPPHESSRDDRLRIRTLYYDAKWTINDIILQTNLTCRQVEYALHHRPTPQKHSSGRHILLNTPKRKQLIQWVTANAQNRRTAWSEIPALLGWRCSLKAIRSAFKKEGYARRIARRKPPISEANRILRLQWAMKHRDWTEEQWDEICWSDESWVQPGTHKKQRVTRKIEFSEIFHPDCVIVKHQRNIGWMFWGTISEKYGRGLGIFWKKSWGKINRFSYSERIIPPLHKYLQSHSELRFQQDNGPGHAA